MNKSQSSQLKPLDKSTKPWKSDYMVFVMDFLGFGNDIIDTEWWGGDSIWNNRHTYGYVPYVFCFPHVKGDEIYNRKSIE